MRTGRILAPSCFMVCPLQVPARSLPRRAPGARARGPCHSHQIVSARCCRSNMLTLPQMQTAPFPPTENMPAGAFCCIVGVCYSHTLPQLQTDMSAPTEYVPEGSRERAYPSASVPSLSLFPLPTFSASTSFCRAVLRPTLDVFLAGLVLVSQEPPGLRPHRVPSPVLCIPAQPLHPVSRTITIVCNARIAVPSKVPLLSMLSLLSTPSELSEKISEKHAV